MEIVQEEEQEQETQKSSEQNITRSEQTDKKELTILQIHQ